MDRQNDKQGKDAQPAFVAWVVDARSGDHQAFAQLVDSFQDLTMGYAYGWLNDPELARDASQDAFLEAYLKLQQLEEPIAFPAWLKRIVAKHCDRITRRKNMQISASPFASQAREPVDSSHGDPEAMLAAEQRAEHLRLAVEALPKERRILIALHYFADATGPQVAHFLDLPLSTVKKRLHTARASLRDQGDRLMQETMEQLKPSSTGAFANEVEFFIAIRAGNTAQAKALLAVNPKLADAVQNWDHELAFEGILPFATKASAVITAIELNDLPMLGLLLDAGADVDGKCACATGETPLWAATLFNRPDHVALLLQRGADPNTAAASGTRPIHVAAMRGLNDIFETLIAAGADADASDSGPQFPRPDEVATPFSGLGSGEGGTSMLTVRNAAGWASLHTSSSSAVIKTETVIDTGIKALDLLAPVPRGGLIRVPCKAGIGMMVLLGELIQRFRAHPESVAIWSGFAQPPYDVEDWESEMAEFGLSAVVERHFSSFLSSAKERRAAFENGLRAAEAERDRGRDVMLVMESTQGFEVDVESSLMRLAQPHPCGSITTFIITPFTKTQNDQWIEPKPPFDAQITLNRTLARAFVYPAISPKTSFSNRLQPPHVSDHHVELADLVRELVSELLAADPKLERLQRDHDLANDLRLDKATRVLEYFRQPFFMTSPWTGHPGVSINRLQMLRDVADILE